jgi:hypothetical protein
MKAEQRHKLEQNELSKRLGKVWQAVNSGSTTATVVWGVILLILVVAIGWRYYSRTTNDTRSRLWYELDVATNVEDLKKVADEAKGSTVGRVAKFHQARVLMQDGMSKLTSANADDRVKAADNLEEARKLYTELASEAELPTLTQEAMMESAKAEEILASVPKADDPNAMRGSLETAMAGYEALAKKYPDSMQGQKASLRAADLHDHGSEVKALYTALSKDHGKVATPMLTPPPQPQANPVPAPPAAKEAGPALPAPEAPKPAPPTDEKAPPKN